VDRLENAKFKEYSWIVIVSGVGFFTDAYSIFAINLVVPILEIVYFKGAMPHKYSVALTITTLAGTTLGMVVFGLSADKWGRRKMYGLELIITIFSTLGVVMASGGVNGSMSVIAWLLVWRFCLGIGIGAEQVYFPLTSAHELFLCILHLISSLLSVQWLICP
jgi:PHS family inorganic phosphate transporter-like MFS transporter